MIWFLIAVWVLCGLGDGASFWFWTCCFCMALGLVLRLCLVCDLSLG